MKEDTKEQLQEKLATSEAKNKALQKEIGIMFKVQKLLIAAELVTKEKFEEAEDLLN